MLIAKRGCVVLDQPQRVDKAGRVGCIEAAAADLRHSRAPIPIHAFASESQGDSIH